VAQTQRGGGGMTTMEASFYLHSGHRAYSSSPDAPWAGEGRTATRMNTPANPLMEAHLMIRRRENMMIHASTSSWGRTSWPTKELHAAALRMGATKKSSPSTRQDGGYSPRFFSSVVPGHENKEKSERRRGHAQHCLLNDKSGDVLADDITHLSTKLDMLHLRHLEEVELRHLFDELDTNADGALSEEEIKEFLIASGMSGSDDEAHEYWELIFQHGADEKPGATTASRSSSPPPYGVMSELVEDKGKPQAAEDDRITWETFISAMRKGQGPVDRRSQIIGLVLTWNFAAQGVLGPVLPLLVRSLGMQSVDLGMISMASSATRICGAVPSAQLAERFGRKPMIVGGPMLGAIAYYSMGLSTNMYEFMLCNALGGLGATITMSGASLYLFDISTPRNRTQTMLPLMMSALVGLSAGPALGGFVAHSYGLNAPFAMCAVGMGISSVCAARFLDETLDFAEKGGCGAKGKPGSGGGRTSSFDLPKQWLALFRRAQMQAIGLSVFSTGFSTGAGPVTSILLASEVLGMSSAYLGVYFSSYVLMITLITPGMTRFSDKVGNRMSLIAPGMCIQSMALLGQSMAPTAEIFFALGVAGAIGNAAVVPNVNAYVVDNSSRVERAQSLALTRMGSDFGILLGAGAMGLIGTMYGIPLAMQIVAVSQITAAGACYLRGGGKVGAWRHHEQPK